MLMEDYQRLYEEINCSDEYDTDLVSLNWATPLVVAAAYGEDDVVEELLAWGADVSAETDEGETALHVVCYYDYSSTLSFLLGHLLEDGPWPRDLEWAADCSPLVAVRNNSLDCLATSCSPAGPAICSIRTISTAMILPCCTLLLRVTTSKSSRSCWTPGPSATYGIMTASRPSISPNGPTTTIARTAPSSLSPRWSSPTAAAPSSPPAYEPMPCTPLGGSLRSWRTRSCRGMCSERSSPSQAPSTPFPRT